MLLAPLSRLLQVCCSLQASLQPHTSLLKPCNLWQEAQ